jgi:hypothetical protein
MSQAALLSSSMAGMTATLNRGGVGAQGGRRSRGNLGGLVNPGGPQGGSGAKMPWTEPATRSSQTAGGALTGAASDGMWSMTRSDIQQRSRGGMRKGATNHHGGMPPRMTSHDMAGATHDGRPVGMHHGSGSTSVAPTPALGTETSVQRPGATFQKQLPEYLTVMASRIKRERAESRAQLGIAAPQESRQTDTTAQTETPPHLIPFQAQGLTLNLAPPHGSMAPPSRPPLLHRRR